MYIDVNGHRSYAYTGGKDFNPAQPTVVLVHGVLCDHSVWLLQSRYLAHHGWNVLADRPARSLQKRRCATCHGARQARPLSKACWMPWTSNTRHWQATVSAR
jgi:hypothetical protein